MSNLIPFSPTLPIMRITGDKISANVIKFYTEIRFGNMWNGDYYVWFNQATNEFVMLQVDKTAEPIPNHQHFVDFSKLNRELLAEFKYKMVNSTFHTAPNSVLSLYDYFAIKMLKDDYIGLTCDLLPIFTQNCDGNYIFSTIKNGVEYDLIIGAEKKSISLLVNGQPTVTFAYLSPYFAIDLIASLDLV